MRSLMGKLNKFALAPGSLSDIGATAEKAKKEVTQSVAQKKKAAPATPSAAPAAVEQKDDNRRGGNRGARRGGRGSDRPRGPPRTVCYINFVMFIRFVVAKR